MKDFLSVLIFNFWGDKWSMEISISDVALTLIKVVGSEWKRLWMQSGKTMEFIRRSDKKAFKKFKVGEKKLIESEGKIKIEGF